MIFSDVVSSLLISKFDSNPDLGLEFPGHPPLTICSAYLGFFCTPPTDKYSYILSSALANGKSSFLNPHLWK